MKNGSYFNCLDDLCSWLLHIKRANLTTVSDSGIIRNIGTSERSSAIWHSCRFESRSYLSSLTIWSAGMIKSSPATAVDRLFFTGRLTWPLAETRVYHRWPLRTYPHFLLGLKTHDILSRDPHRRLWPPGYWLLDRGSWRPYMGQNQRSYASPS